MKITEKMEIEDALRVMHELQDAIASNVLKGEVKIQDITDELEELDNLCIHLEDRGYSRSDIRELESD